MAGFSSHPGPSHALEVELRAELDYLPRWNAKVAIGAERVALQERKDLLGDGPHAPGLASEDVVAPEVIGHFVTLPVVARRAHQIGVGKPHFEQRELAALMRSGGAFLAFSLAMTLQGLRRHLDALEARDGRGFGWNAAAQKLIGALLFPATALIASLYPTLSRLVVEDLEQFKITLRRAINGTGLPAIPLALGCALYSGLGIAL